MDYSLPTGTAYSAFPASDWVAESGTGGTSGSGSTDSSYAGGTSGSPPASGTFQQCYESGNESLGYDCNTVASLVSGAW
ncbi:MAG: hypothetical protein ABSG68_24485, partial [Thermoguttaceae bacterium]